MAEKKVKPLKPSPVALSHVHPELVDDAIRELSSDERPVPGKLQELLFQTCGHACSICRAPWLEIHHIEHFRSGGRTTYENLIVLCPNCHTRVHKTGTPSNRELKFYKRRTEMVYEYPDIGKFSAEEKSLLNKAVNLPDGEIMSLVEVVRAQIANTDVVQAETKARKKIPYKELEARESLNKSLDTGVMIAAMYSA